MLGYRTMGAFAPDKAVCRVNRQVLRNAEGKNREAPLLDSASEGGVKIESKQLNISSTRESNGGAQSIASNGPIALPQQSQKREDTGSGGSEQATNDLQQSYESSTPPSINGGGTADQTEMPPQPEGNGTNGGVEQSAEMHSETSQNGKQELDSDIILPSGDILTKEGGRIAMNIKSGKDSEVQEVTIQQASGPQSTKIVYEADEPRNNLMEKLLKDTTKGIMAYDGRIRTWKEKLNDVELVQNPEIEQLREKAKSKEFWDTMQKIAMLNRLSDKLRPSQISLLKGLYSYRLNRRADAERYFKAILRMPKDQVPKKERVLAVYNLLSVHASWGDYEVCIPLLDELLDAGFDFEKYMKFPKPGMVYWRGVKQVEVMLKREYRKQLMIRRRVRRVLVSTPNQSVPLLQEPVTKQLQLIGYALMNKDVDMADLLAVGMKDGMDKSMVGLIRRFALVIVGVGAFVYLGSTYGYQLLFPEALREF